MDDDLTAKQQEKVRRGNVEKLQSDCVGALIHIIEDLDELKLSADDIHSVIKECGLDYKKAMLTGLTIRNGGEPSQA